MTRALSPRVRQTRILASLKAQGFDLSLAFAPAPTCAVRCSQCEALVINGIACHETGCPNQRFECKGCNASVERKGQYCGDCQ